MKNLILMFGFCAFLFSGTAFAKHKEMSPDERKKAAAAHEAMAACLKSDKAAKDCHKEMRASMKEMMGGKHGGKGHKKCDKCDHDDDGGDAHE